MTLKPFSTYRVKLEHWALLAAPFRDRFEAIYAQGEAASLLVYGNQGSTTALFDDRLEEATRDALLLEPV